MNEMKKAVEQFLQGNEKEFESIYQLSYNYLYVCALKIIPEEEEAKDVLQDAYIDIYRGLHNLKDAEKFLNWAAMIVNRKCFAYLKKHNRIQMADLSEDSEEIENLEADEEFIPEIYMQNKEKQRLLGNIIDGLSEMQRLCIIGYFFNQQTQEEIAKELGIPVNTVKTNISRGKAKIKTEVLQLEKEHGTKLYGLGAFILLYLSLEMEVCQAMPRAVDAEKIVRKGKKKIPSSKKFRFPKMGLALGVGAAVLTGVLGFGVLPMMEKQDNVYQSVEKLVGLEQYEEMKVANRGRVCVQKEGKWGLVSYDNKIIVPLEYEECCILPNNDGYTFFSKNGISYVFDKEGKEIFHTDKKVSAVSEGIIVAEDEDEIQGYSCAYYKLDGTLLGESEVDEEYPVYPGDASAVGFHEGSGFFRDDCKKRIDKDGEITDLTLVEYAEEIEEVKRENEIHTGYGVAWAEEGYEFPIGAMAQGYYFCQSRGDGECANDYYYVCSKDGEIKYRLAMASLYLYAGEKKTQSQKKYSFYVYWDNGVTLYNYGTLVCVELKEGEKGMCYLIDTSKLEQPDISLLYGPECLDYDASRITEESMVAKAEFILPSKEKYWLIKDNGKWGYIDHEGNVLHIYDDASEFWNKKALIIEDGMAYWIDESFEKSQPLCEATSVSCYGEIFKIEQPNGECFFVK